jgi:hypothetical protein
MIVLHEAIADAQFRETPLMIALKEEATLIAGDVGLEDNQPRDFGFYNLQSLLRSRQHESSRPRLHMPGVPL